MRAATPRRRVAVLVLGDDEGRPDESLFGAEARAAVPRRDLRPARRLARSGLPPGGAWGDGLRIATPQEFVDAFAALRAELDSQRICWVAEDLDPASFRLAPEDQGLALAGRGAGAAPLTIASAAEAEEPGALAAAATPAPGKEPRKSVAASQEVGLVNLDAFVADGKGRRVTGLKASDFTLRVGGQAGRDHELLRVRAAGRAARRLHVRLARGARGRCPPSARSAASFSSSTA